jgi:hypothetical protein
MAKAWITLLVIFVMAVIAVAQTSRSNPVTDNPPTFDVTLKFMNNMVEPEERSISSRYLDSTGASVGCTLEIANNGQHKAVVPSSTYVKSVDALGIKHYGFKYAILSEGQSFESVPLTDVDPTSVKSFSAASPELIEREKPDENPEALKNLDRSVVVFKTRTGEATIEQGSSTDSRGVIAYTEAPMRGGLLIFVSKDRAERFVTAFVHAVKLCGGKPGDFAPTPSEDAAGKH